MSRQIFLLSSLVLDSGCWLIIFSFGWNQLVSKHCQRWIPHTIEFLKVLISYKTTLVPCCDLRIEAFYTMCKMLLYFINILNCETSCFWINTIVNMITLSNTHPKLKQWKIIQLHYNYFFFFYSFCSNNYFISIKVDQNICLFESNLDFSFNR
jgi:hypothetical protein